MLGVERDVDRPYAAVHRNGTSVAARSDALDARSGACLEESQHPRPVIRRPKTQVEYVLVFRLTYFLAREMPDLSWCAFVGLANGCVESSDTAEARSERNLAHGELSLIDQLLRKVETPGLSDRARRSAQMPNEQTAQMACSDAK